MADRYFNQYKDDRKELDRVLFNNKNTRIN